MRARSTRSAIMLVSTPRDCCLESSEEFSAVMRDCAESPVEFELDATAAISLRAQFISMTASVGANNPVAEFTMVLGLARRGRPWEAEGSQSGTVAAATWARQVTRHGTWVEPRSRATGVWPPIRTGR